MSWRDWSNHYFNKGKEDFEQGVDRQPKDNLIVNPSILDGIFLDADKPFTIEDAQSSYIAGRSQAGADAADDK